MDKYFIIKSTYPDEEGKIKNIYYYVSLKNDDNEYIREYSSISTCKRNTTYC